jgi:hypothetical protein
LRWILPSRTKRSSRARVLRVSRARISRETAVQDSRAYVSPRILSVSDGLARCLIERRMWLG